MTVGVTRLADKSEPFAAFLVAQLARHPSDWGDLCSEDAQANDEALIDEHTIFSSYQIDPRLLADAPIENDQDRLWIITEADRSATTIRVAP